MDGNRPRSTQSESSFIAPFHWKTRTFPIWNMSSRKKFFSAPFEFFFPGYQRKRSKEKEKMEMMWELSVDDGGEGIRCREREERERERTCHRFLWGLDLFLPFFWRSEKKARYGKLHQVIFVVISSSSIHFTSILLFLANKISHINLGLRRWRKIFMVGWMNGLLQG